MNFVMADFNELHAHLNGSISFNTISKLQALYGSESEVFTRETALRNNLMLQKPATMEEVFKIFPLIHSLTTTRNSIITANYLFDSILFIVIKVTKDVIKEFSDDGVIYLELRSTPRASAELSKEQYVEAIVDGIIEASKESMTVTRLLLSIDRGQSFESAEETVRLAATDKSGLIVGIDLSGNPSLDGRKFLPLLQKARESGLKVAVHLAEVDHQLDEVNDFLEFKPDRIGHGTFLHTQEASVKTIVREKIPLEICLTSNVMSMTTSSIADSHLRFWMKHSVPFCICTDDKGVMNCELSSELWKASVAFNLSMSDLWKLSADALQMSFLEKTSDDYVKLEELLKPHQCKS
ncbi:putative adenosine deaminase [Dictyocaulus viviparus]|uniref:Putative adenosine deaminase n=1 Tax=Dictyocaulus viviparus TaxID=29172 RepID=A0A0D8XU23_DICVI|nr:putative adenosine deaminase [Dictyocaulus viviparus]